MVKGDACKAFIRGFESLSRLDSVNRFDMKRLSKKLHSDWSVKKPLYLNKKDKRYSRYVKQLKTNGFSDTETWGLYSVITQFVLPRLIRFKEITCAYPTDLTSEQWNEILDKMIFAFQWIEEDASDYYFKLSNGQRNENDKKCEEGLKLFAEYFRGLWW